MINFVLGVSAGAVVVFVIACFRDLPLYRAAMRSFDQSRRLLDEELKFTIDFALALEKQNDGKLANTPKT